MIHYPLKTLLLLFIFISSNSVFTAVLAENATKITKDTDAFIQQLIEKEGFSKAQLKLWFLNAKANQSILKKIHRPAEAALKWHQYRNIFIQQERIDLGVKFWNKYQDTLHRAEETYGVPAELIVGLIGVETKYGRIKGKLDVFNALYTLSFYYPRRAKFFKSELKQFLMLAREQKWTANTIKGSYAGAMGYGQFMPSSYRMYAVDFDGDGLINLIDNPVDAIGSVANYIKVHGWKTGESIVQPVDVSGDDFGSLKQRGLKPKLILQNFIDAGISLKSETAGKTLSVKTKAVLIELEQKETTEYWLGFHNFYVISRYNPRKLYTMAVIELSRLIFEQKHSLDSKAVRTKS